MTTFSKILVRCPHCKCLMYEYELMSYTVHHVNYFSDGKTESHTFFSPGHRIGICSDCNSPLWKEDARSDLDPYDEKYADLPEVKDLFDLNSMLSEQFQIEIIRFFQKLLEDGFANTRERTFYLRQQLWWAINDLVRNIPQLWQFLKFWQHSYPHLKILFKARKKSLKDFKLFKPLFLENLEKLSALIQLENDEDLLMLSELYREQGHFRKAGAVLKKVSDKTGRAYRQIKRAATWRRKSVFEII